MQEVRATVADYFEMLECELVGDEYSKAEHNRTLRLSLLDRTKGAVELKHQNISAVLLEMGFVFIPGYKPMGNYQKLLADVVIEQL
jgi:ribosome maturation factor RimP